MADFLRCKDCKHDKGKCVGVSRRASHKNCFEPKVMTNADRIREMSDEELAKVLTTIADGDVYSIFCNNPKRTVVCSGKCKQCIVEWLKQPADDWYCADGERKDND